MTRRDSCRTGHQIAPQTLSEPENVVR